MEPSDIPESTTSYEYDPQSFLCEKRTFVFATVSTTILYCLVFFLSLVVACFLALSSVHALTVLFCETAVWFMSLLF